MVVRAENIKTRFGSKLIHDGVSFNIKENEIFGILGGSGSGKSVLLKQMLMLEHFDSGEYEILGYKLKNISQKNALKLQQKWGVVFQFAALFSFFSVFENIAIPLKEYTKLDNMAIYEIVLMKLKMVGLQEHVLNLYPSELSGGMQKRVAIARALALDSKLLFLDEPTSGLDPYSSREFDELVLNLKHSFDLNVILVTHDKNSMKTLLDRFIILENKKVGFIGTCEELEEQNERLFKKFME
ncbi:MULTISPECIES: ABC transporter ATP-binding protein [unclassified Campylobacter]|uniref:ABC transporter ATP-binding protein n=1 Tax=unclassified Campylobacter TaxID=2593542 RepID=UPI001237F7A5|nr:MULTISPECIES: ATP-binding cassette domain-containing protein [unclassified Campylobacter]KAA6227347.1 ATP-binding cassette domain-containing protein [Campylobacter sp. LR286c]KAA6227966.1 ATP-binding cassette domain-containing protein [Campylobacter sp. LR185c]KAA6228376.1 ATP-binding cassette domain-containing protein [Campylobacter sp. LR196d]KAA6229377.1 ATP-binding cassette domain-containing protein [Campylobacter sp. LR291e]KAA6231183.1 ATP-binding cassette domain-containing protein [C